MIDAGQLRLLVVRPALVDADVWSPAAENLVMGTAAQESSLVYLHQVGGGPALGLWQMEPATHHDIWTNYLAYQAPLATRILSASMLMTADSSPFEVPDQALVFNLKYAALMCRAHYRRRPEPLPEANDVAALAAYWKLHYNTPAGAGTEDEFMRHYQLTEAV